MKTRYELIIYWSKDDESFVVEVPELPGCMADGQTYAEAVANAEVVIDAWIYTAHKLGRPIPEPRGNWHTRDFSAFSRFNDLRFIGSRGDSLIDRRPESREVLADFPRHN